MQGRLVAGDRQRSGENRIGVSPLLVVLGLEPLDNGAAAMQREPTDRRRALLVTITLTFDRSSSVMMSPKRSNFPSADRRSMTMFRPST